MASNNSFSWDFVVSLAPRIIIIAICVFFVNVMGSAAQMCYSRFTIPGTCVNPEYVSMYYTYTLMGFVVGVWAVFIYNIWTMKATGEGGID